MDLQPEEHEAFQQFAERFNLNIENSVLLNRSVGIVIEALFESKPVVIKISSGTTDESAFVSDQIDWVNYLSSNGVSVATFIASRSDNFIEKIKINNCYYLAFVNVKINLSNENTINWDKPDNPFLVGKTMGKMHSLAKQRQKEYKYESLGGWDRAPWLKTPEKVFHPSQQILFNSIHDLYVVLSGFKISQENYGLIHDDFHTGNIFRINNSITVLDFGCLQYNWYAQDICSALIFRVWISSDKYNMQDKVLPFLHEFIKGYTTENGFDKDWLNMFPALLKARELSLYFSFFGKEDINYNSLNDFGSFVFDSIKNRSSFLNIDFSSVV